MALFKQRHDTTSNLRPLEWHYLNRGCTHCINSAAPAFKILQPVENWITQIFSNVYVSRLALLYRASTTCPMLWIVSKEDLYVLSTGVSSNTISTPEPWSRIPGEKTQVRGLILDWVLKNLHNNSPSKWLSFVSIEMFHPLWPHDTICHQGTGLVQAMARHWIGTKSLVISADNYFSSIVLFEQYHTAAASFLGNGSKGLIRPALPRNFHAKIHVSKQRFSNLASDWLAA